MSEMFIPHSVWEQSHQYEYGIFQLIEADILHEMMKDIFTQRVGMSTNYFLEPFTVKI
jgi:hypothetical protein